jgi:hypothetical protein
LSLKQKIMLLWHGDKQMREVIKPALKAENDVAWSIYSQGKPEKANAVAKRLWAVHVTLKGRIIKPALWLLKKYNKKHYKGVPAEAHNQNLRVFDRAYDKAITEWHQKVLRNAYKHPTVRSEEYWNKVEKEGPSGDLLRTAKETTLLVALTDTAYRNFLDLLMYNIYTEMHREYKGQQIHHLIYTSSDISDPAYYQLHRCIKTGETRVYAIGDKTCCEFQAIKEAAELIAADARGDFLEKVYEAESQGKRLSDHAHKVIEEIQKIEKEKFKQS